VSLYKRIAQEDQADVQFGWGAAEAGTCHARCRTVQQLRRKENSKGERGVCEIKMSRPQTTETDGVVVSGHVLGKKKSGVASRGFPGNQWHDAVSSEKTLAPAVTRRKKEKKKAW
jgi:hypothetical protein